MAGAPGDLYPMYRAAPNAPGRSQPKLPRLSGLSERVLQGLTAYQTDWSIAAVTLRVRTQDAQTSEEPLRVNLPVASLEGQPGELQNVFLKLEWIRHRCCDTEWEDSGGEQQMTCM